MYRMVGTRSKRSANQRHLLAAVNSHRFIEPKTCSRSLKVFMDTAEGH